MLITGHLDAEEIEQAALVLGQTMGFLVSNDDIDVRVIGLHVQFDFNVPE